MAINFDTTCPFCGQHHEAVSRAHSSTDYPDDGDVTMCFACGEICVFDSDAAGGLRKPTKPEQRNLDRDQHIRDMREVWRIVKRQ
jgi:hypothetical protein